MKKPSTLLLIALFTALTTLAQKDAPSYGKVGKEELQMTTCDFDPEAEAVILIKVGETTMSLSGDQPMLQTDYRVRIKILKDKGTEQANVQIPYFSYDKTDMVSNISGDTYNVDASGNIVKSKLDHSGIYYKDLNRYVSEAVFSLPDVKKGSVFEYKYSKISRAYTEIDPWYFQDVIPTAFCQFFLHIPEYFDFTSHQVLTLPMDVKDESTTDMIKTYTMKNIPGIRAEPYMSAARDYMQRLEFQLDGIKIPNEPYRSVHGSWLGLNKELLESEYFGTQLHKNIPHTQELDKQLAILKDTVARMAAVYDYVRQHMNWDGATGIYSDGVKAAWEKRSAGISDINLILVNLLRDAGVDADPLLVSTRQHGRANPFSPLLAQFNETMATVNVDGHRYVLNAADKINPYHLIPYDVHYTAGYIVDADNPHWVILVNDKPYKTVVVLSGEMNDQGTVTGTAEVSSYNYSRNPRCESLKQGMDKFKEAYFTKGYGNLKIDSLSVVNQDNDSLPLRQDVAFTSPLNHTGQYLFFSPNLFLGLEENPFVAERRFTDVDFGYQQSYLMAGAFQIPDGYEFEGLPKDMRMMLPDTSVVLIRMMQAEGNLVNYRISLEFRRHVYSIDEYADFREFYKKLFEKLNEPILIRKKSA